MLPRDLTPRKIEKCRRCDKDFFWSWDRAKKRRMKVEPKVYDADGNCTCYERVHECQGDDIRPTTCRYCGSKDVVWVKTTENKFVLLESYGLQHVCDAFKKIYNDHREALKENYAYEKKWISSQPDGKACTACQGKGYRFWKRRKIEPPNTVPGVNIRSCRKCKNIGTFTPDKKKDYLATLRKKYWPWKYGMPWSKANAV